MNWFVNLIKESSSAAGLIGVVIGALISFAGTIVQHFLTKQKEDTAYERADKEKKREERQKIYVKCLEELLDIKAKYYYKEEMQGTEHEDDTIKIESQAAIDLVASPEIKKKMENIVGELHRREGDVTAFEKAYKDLSELMKKDLKI